MIKKTIKDEKTDVTVESEGLSKNPDKFSIHLGNPNFALEMSREELEAMQKLIAEILEN
jgi:hypothetical protein